MARINSKNFGYKVPNHILSSKIKSKVSPDIHEKYGVNSVRLRKDDSVKIIRGEYKGVEGKITKIFVSQNRISVEGVTREKIAGGNVPIKIHTSNVVVTNMNMNSDRKKMFDSKSKKGEI